MNIHEPVFVTVAVPVGVDRMTATVVRPEGEIIEFAPVLESEKLCYNFSLKDVVLIRKYLDQQCVCTVKYYHYSNFFGTYHLEAVIRNGRRIERAAQIPATQMRAIEELIGKKFSALPTVRERKGWIGGASDFAVISGHAYLRER